jgi:hypothetical protein
MTAFISDVREILRQRGFRLLMGLVLGSWLLMATLACVGVGVIWMLGGIGTRGEELDWTVVAAVSGVISALTSIATASALGLAAVEFDRQAEARSSEARRDRVSRMPYVRADVGFAGHLQSAGFEPPGASRIFTMEEFKSEVLFPNVRASIGSSDGHQVVLWLTNLQTQPLGIASGVRVEVLVGWESRSGVPSTEAGELELTYLAPESTTAVELFRVRPNLGVLRVTVHRVEYCDLFGAVSRDTHGALTLQYNGREVLNDREVRRHSF